MTKETRSDFYLFDSLWYPNKTLKYFDLLPSTNDFAYEWVMSEGTLPAGSVVLADYQTQGKGQANRVWYSAPGVNLTFSMIYKPRFLPPDQAHYLNMITSLAVYEAIEFILPPNKAELHIKWPNDVLINGKKVAGILIRNVFSGKAIATSIIGIGVNVLQEKFPPEAGNATSLRLAGARHPDRNFLLNKIINQFEPLLDHLDGDMYAYASIKADYLCRLYGIMQTGRFEAAGEVFEAKIVNVDAEGRLVLVRDGKLSAYRHGEIRFVALGSS